MFNTLSISKTKLTIVLSCFLVFVACQKKAVLTFSETEVSKAQETLVEIVIPKANGNSNIAQNINKTLTGFACNILNIDSAKNKKETIEESIEAFNKAYINFSKTLVKEFDIDFPKWGALIDGEVSYQNDHLVSIAMNGNITNGSPSSTLKFRFFNFDLANGKLLKTEDIINNMQAFKGIVKKYYDKELLTTYTSLNNDSKNFKLPETIGFNEDGVIIIYDNFELQNFTKELIEFTIPFSLLEEYLNY
ncbi:PdaC/SigV domain-containing protein [Olleya sp. R77988]|uniref:PdaC/SigV domain-containing protein n=1 Tax=Olleya sp. R77988 TaxID=3093875 RepID=UPI0037C9D893